MATEGVDIELRVKIDKLREELMKIPGITKESAEAMLRTYSSAYKQVENAAEKAKRKLQKEAKESADAWKGAAERTASLMGGAFGDISDSLLDLGERFGKVTNGLEGWQKTAAMGAAGATALGFALTFAGAAAIGVAHATIDMAKASTEAAQRLEDMGLLTDAQAARSDALRLKVAGLAVAQDQVSASFADSTPIYTNVVSLVTGITVAIGNTIDMMGHVIPMAQQVTDALSTAFAPPVGLAIQAIRDELIEYGSEASTALGTVAEASKKTGERLRALGDDQLVWAGAIRQTNEEAEAMLVALGVLDPATKKNEGSTKKLATEVDKLAEARRKEQDAMRASTADAVAQADERARYEGAAARMQTADREALERAHQATLTAIRTEGTQAAIALEQDLAAGQQAALQTVRDQATANALTAIEMLATAQMEAIGREIDSRRTAHRANMAALDTQRETIAARLEDGKITAAQAAEQLAAIDAREARQRAVNKAAREDEAKALKAAFAAQKAAAISQVLMQAAIATVSLTAGLAYLGFGALPAALAITGPLAATQVGLIAAEKAPKFATGGMVGEMDPMHRFVAATPREGILTERGVDMVGGPQALDALNRGESMGGGGVSAVMLDGAVLGAAVVQTMRNDPSVRREMARRGGMVPGQRARYSGRG